MSHIEEIGNNGGDSLQNKLDKWGYTPGKGFASTASQSNTGNNTTRENSNDRLNNSTMEAGQAGAGGINASIKASQQSGNSFGGSQQDSNSQGQRETTAFSNVARAKEAANGMKAAVQVSFADLDQETVRTNQLRSSLVQQMNDRLGIQLNPDDIQGMEAADLQSAIRAMAQRKRPESSAADLNQFINIVDNARPDFFEAISIEELQQQ